MAIFNRSIKINKDTGFSNTSSSNAGRFLNRDGKFNITREGLPFFKRISIYHYLLELSFSQFILVTFISIFLINIFYATIYYLIGFHNFTGFIDGDRWQHFKELLYFSAQTFTTVGYGRINPISDMANVVSSIEAITGFLSFAFITGLLYGRFSKPKANLTFSKNAIVAPYLGIKGLMFRFAASKDSHILSDVTVRVNLGMRVMEDDKPVFKFYDLDLERSRIDSLPMNFTVVHPIDERSPLWQYTNNDYEVGDVELYVLVRAFDDVYSAIVQQRTSYIFSEILHDVKFMPMYRESADGSNTILEMQNLNKTIRVS